MPTRTAASAAGSVAEWLPTNKVTIDQVQAVLARLRYDRVSYTFSEDAGGNFDMRVTVAIDERATLDRIVADVIEQVRR